MNLITGDTISVKYTFEDVAYKGMVLYVVNGDKDYYAKVVGFGKKFGNWIGWPSKKNIRCHTRVLLTEKKIINESEWNN